MARDYKAEYARQSKKTRADKAARNRAARKKKCPPGKTVHHKDNDPQNNKKSNLECVTQGANNRKIKRKGNKAHGKRYSKK